MKPADRALDMVVVGLGQAGGNLATEFARLGYRAMALNTAHTDLSSLAGDRAFSLTADQRVYIGIDGYDGAGADMNYGKECVQENAERIRKVVGNHADGADVVIITAGLGGGTGSSVSELVKVLTALDLPMIVLATLPNEYESGIAKVNAVRAVSDLVKQSNVGWIFADNHRLSQLHGGVSLDKYFEKINSVIIQPLDAFNRLNDRKGIHPIRTLDGEDFRALLLSNGVINYSETTISALTVDAVCDRVRETLMSSAMMPAGFASEEVAYMGIVLEASEDVLRGTPFSFYEQLNEQLKHDTGGSAIYMGVYRMDKPVDNGAALLRVIASTQSLPAGVQTMVNDARREGGTLRDKLQRSMSALDLGEIEDFDLFKTTMRTGNSQSNRSRRPPAPQLAVPEVPLRRTSGRATQDSPAKSDSSERGAGDADPDPGPSKANAVTPLSSVNSAASVGSSSAAGIANLGHETPAKSLFGSSPSLLGSVRSSGSILSSGGGLSVALAPVAVPAATPAVVPVAVEPAEPVSRFSSLPPSSKREPDSIRVPNFDDDTAVGTSDMLAAASAEGRGAAELESAAVDADVDLIEAEADLASSMDAALVDTDSDLVDADAESEIGVKGESFAAIDSGAQAASSVAGLLSAEANPNADADLGEDRESGLIDVELDDAEASDAVLLEEEDTDIRRSGTFADGSWGPPAAGFEAPTDPLRISEADGYNKLVSTFLRTEFDSTRRRVARRLDAARKSADETSKQLAERALERVRDAGQVKAFEDALTD